MEMPGFSAEASLYDRSERLKIVDIELSQDVRSTLILAQAKVADRMQEFPNDIFCRRICMRVPIIEVPIGIVGYKKVCYWTC